MRSSVIKMKELTVYLKSRSLIDDCVVRCPVRFLVVIHPMLARGDDTLALNAADHGLNHRETEKRILATVEILSRSRTMVLKFSGKKLLTSCTQNFFR